jgi:hypothetical protein
MTADPRVANAQSVPQCSRRKAGAQAMLLRSFRAHFSASLTGPAATAQNASATPQLEIKARKS